MIHPNSKEWRGYYEEALMAQFVKLDFLPTRATPEAIVPLTHNTDEDEPLPSDGMEE